MVLCNSQREEGLVPSQICRTSNRVIPQNYKINLEPIFNFLRLFYWIIVEKTSMSRSAGKHFSLRRKLHRSYFLSCYFWTNWPEVALSETLRMSEQPSSKDDVRRGLGMLPQQALFVKAPKGDFAKMSEPVQVYTACQFVKGQNMALIYFQLGNNSTMPPVANSSTGRNTLFPYLNLCPTWVQVKLRVLTIGPVPKLGTSQRAGTVPLANLARSYFYSRRVVGKLYGNFRPTWS